MITSREKMIFPLMKYFWIFTHFRVVKLLPFSKENAGSPPFHFFSQPVFQSKNFPYKFPKQLKTSSKAFWFKCYRRLSEILLWGKRVCEKSDLKIYVYVIVRICFSRNKEKVIVIKKALFYLWINWESMLRNIF